MQRNRTMPDDVLVPVLGYPLVSEAVVWLTKAFGFTFRWQIEDHRAPSWGLARTPRSRSPRAPFRQVAATM